MKITHNWGSWFYFKDHTIIRVFGSPVTPRCLPITIQDKVAFLEIMHQLADANKSLMGGSHKKGLMIPSQVVIGMYHFLNRKAYDILHSMLNKYRLPWVEYRYYDSEWFVRSLGKANPQDHQWDTKNDEDLIRNATDYEEVLKRKARWCKIQYEEDIKRKHDSSYSPSWEPL